MDSHITNNESCIYDDVSYTEESDENYYTAEEETDNSYTDEEREENYTDEETGKSDVSSIINVGLIKPEALDKLD